MSEQSTKYPFAIIPRSRVWFIISALLIVGGMAKLVMNKAATGESLNYGVDFKGGAAYVFKFDQRPGGSPPEVIQNVRGVLDGLGIEGPKIEEFTGGDVQVRTMTGAGESETATGSKAVQEEAAAILEALRAKYGNVELTSRELVGPVMGAYLRSKALIAVLIGSVLVMIFVAWRYNIGGLGGGWVFGACAVVAILHDVLITIGVYAWTGTEVNTNFVAALLTIVGYSVNDTVIIFDRVRENVRGLESHLRRNIDVIAQSVEDSVWQTMTRSVMTVGMTLLPLVALFLFGGVTIRDFAFGMLVGIFCGAYSSIFNATPLLVAMQRRQLRKQVAVSGPVRPSARPKAPAAATPKPATPKPAAPKPAAPAAAAPVTDGEATPAKPAGGTKKKKGGGGKRRY